jgi:hypothetical protein
MEEPHVLDMLLRGYGDMAAAAHGARVQPLNFRQLLGTLSGKPESFSDLCERLAFASEAAHLYYPLQRFWVCHASIPIQIVRQSLHRKDCRRCTTRLVRAFKITH